MSIIQGTSKSSAAAAYSIDQSIRFNDNDSAHLSRTPSSAGDKRTWTWSCWIKRANIGIEQELLFCGPTGSNLFQTQFSANNTFYINDYNGSNQLLLITDRVFRDPSAWFHLMFVFDTTQATSSDRAKLYINGQRETSFSTETYPSLNYEGRINATTQHTIGEKWTNTSKYLDAYLAEINFIDGTALVPTDFGETNADTGQWAPIEYTNAAGYGTNGFYLKGQDSSALGDDSSGNNNDWTSSGLAAADQVTDSPTDNFCTWNPLKTNASATLSDGNLNYTASGAQRTTSTFAVNSGKWYAEFTISAATGSQTWGVVDIAQVSLSDAYIGQRSYEWGIDGLARTWNNGSNAADYTDFTAGDVIGIALDMDNGKVWFRDNDGTFLSGGDPAAGTTPDFSGLSGDICFAAQFTGGNVTINCGQSAYTNTPPTGFNALSTANLPDPTTADPSAYFQTTLYTGNASTQEVNQSGNSNFEPGFVWIKTRSNAASHALFDQVRGVNKQLRSDSSGAEYTAYSDLLTSFDADGFTLGADATVNNVNVNTYTYAAWQWKADGTSGSSNTDGSITSTVSADTTSGFSIVSYTGTGANATVGHGLNQPPSMVICKQRNASRSWVVYHEGLTSAANVIYLDLTSAQATDSTVWNSTDPTSTVFSVGSANGSNSSGNGMIAYCFAEIPAFSRISSFVGNGSSDGPMIYTGFRPAFFMMKRYDSTGAWLMFDDKRDGYNVDNDNLRADQSVAEQTDDFIDIVSNGVKIRSSATTWLNASGGGYLYMAFASSPFKTATAR